MAQPHVVSRVRVRYAETDQMGVAYHANYLAWCEIGRTDLMREFGASYARMEADGIRLAVAEATIRYRLPARYDDVLRVETILERAGSRGVTFSYRIVLEEPATAGTAESLVATASTALIAIDTAGRTRHLPAETRERFAELLASAPRTREGSPG